MKKSLYFVVAAFALLATFVSCASPESEKPKNEKSLVILTPTQDGVEMELTIPAGVSNVEIIRKDLDTNEQHVCCNINYNPNPSTGDTFTLTDYFVEGNTNYEYKIKYIRNRDWNNPEYITRTVRSTSGYGLLTVFATKPTYNSVNNRFENMVLNNISADGIEGFFTVNIAANDTENWRIDDGGTNMNQLKGVDSVTGKAYFDITYLLNYVGSGIDDNTIRVIPVINSYERGAWINYSGITSYYKNGAWN